MQGIAAGVVLLGFVADFRFVVVVVALGLVVTLATDLVERSDRITWLTEIGLLVLATVLLLLGRAGWAWLLGCAAAGVAALAAAADVWVAPGYVRRPK
jgi:aminoglycoside phosphotransferase